MVDTDWRKRAHKFFETHGSGDADAWTGLGHFTPTEHQTVPPAVRCPKCNPTGEFSGRLFYQRAPLSEPVMCCFACGYRLPVREYQVDERQRQGREKARANGKIGRPKKSPVPILATKH